jgi:hypothetical protein
MWSNYTGVSDVLRLLASYAHAAGTTLKELGSGVASGDLVVVSNFLYEVLMWVLRSPYQIYFAQLYLTTLLPLFKADKTLSVVEKLLRVYSFINYFARIQALMRLSGVSNQIGMDVLLAGVLGALPTASMPTLQSVATETEKQLVDKVGSKDIPQEALKEAHQHAQSARASIEQAPRAHTAPTSTPAQKVTHAMERSHLEANYRVPRLGPGYIPTPTEHARLLGMW